MADYICDIDMAMPEYFTEEICLKKFFELVRLAFAESVTLININKMARKHIDGIVVLIQYGKKTYVLFKEGSKYLFPDFDS